ncbi:hypothetical protein ACXAUS_004018 [Clostridium sporogenes]
MKFNNKIILYIFIIIISLNSTGCSSIKYINEMKSVKETQEKIPVPKNYLDNIVKKYIGPQGIQPNFGGKTFYDYKIIGSEKNKDTIKIYLYYTGQEYYIENNKLVEGTGGNSFATVTIKKENNNYRLINYEVPKSSVEEDNLKIFPKSIRKKAIKSTVPSSENIKKDADAYFKKFKN